MIGAPLSAREILLGAIETVIGAEADVARYLARAIDSDDPLDLLLAKAAFDELDADLRRDIVHEVEERTGPLGRAERRQAA
jgi:hypothetical protein